MIGAGDGPGCAERAAKLLENSRQVNWEQIVLASHVIYALGNAIARLGHEDPNGKLPWSKESILRVYFQAFQALGRAHGGCIVRYNKWMSEFDVSVPCKGFRNEPGFCNRNQGRLFARLRSDSSLDYLSVRDTKTDPWWVGQKWVKQEYVFAVRNAKRELLALVNLNLAEGCPTPSEFCFGAMVHLARQLAMFFEMERFFQPVHARLELITRVNRITSTRRFPADTGEMCASIANALAKQSGAYNSRREYLIWLVDQTDFSERQFNEATHVLTCYSIGSRFRAEDRQFAYIEDIPVTNWGAVRRLIDLSVMAPADLEREYPELRKSRAFSDGFVPLKDGHHHLMVLPIVDEDDRERTSVLGLLIVVDSVTEYITEEDREDYLVFCHRLFEALNLVAERSRRKIEDAARECQPVVGGNFTLDAVRRSVRAYLEKVVESIHQATRVEGVSVFLQENYPEHDPTRVGPVVLWAAHNLLQERDGGTVIIDGLTGTAVPSERFHEVRYEPNEGCTGFSVCQAEGCLRISDLAKHKHAFEEGRATEPHWIGRWQEVRNPEIGRRGVICVPLRGASGSVFGVLRASSRRDTLRLTRFDQDAFSKIADMLSGQIELFTYQAQLGRRGQALATMSSLVEAILRLPPTERWYATALQRSVLVPIIHRSGLGLGRAAYCEVRGDCVIVSPVGIGGISASENRRVKDLAAEAFASVIAADLTKPPANPYEGLWSQLDKDSLTKFRDRLSISVDPATLANSTLGTSLRKGAYRIVRPGNGLDPVDEAVMKVCQGDWRPPKTFAYVPIIGMFSSAKIPTAFIYVDSPFDEDEAVTEDAVRAIQTFASVLGGVWSAVELRDQGASGIRHISHEVGNLLAGVGFSKRAADDGKRAMAVSLAYYRARAVLAAFDPTKRHHLRSDEGQTTDVADSMRRLFRFYRVRACGQGLAADAVVPPPRTTFRVQCPPDILDAILGQLLDNAVKYLARAPREQRAGFTKPRLVDEGRFVELGVWDTGPGMPEDRPEDLFVRPYRGQTDIDGAGVGLLTCKMLLNLYSPQAPDRDNIWPEGPTVGGTIFRVLLPSAAPAEPQATSRAAARGIAKTKAKRKAKPKASTIARIDKRTR